MYTHICTYIDVYIFTYIDIFVYISTHENIHTQPLMHSNLLTCRQYISTPIRYS